MSEKTGKCQNVWLDPDDFQEILCGKETDRRARHYNGEITFMCSDCFERSEKFKERFKMSENKVLEVKEVLREDNVQGPSDRTEPMMDFHKRIKKGLDRKIRELESENRSLRKTIENLKDERREFDSKQVGMSHLVTVLMNDNFHGEDEICIGRDEFIRFGSEAATLREDNKQLKDALAKIKGEQGLFDAKMIAHKMALQESVGGKIAELVSERDKLQEELDALKTEDPDDSKES
jgi:hypothetical protein